MLYITVMKKGSNLDQIKLWTIVIFTVLVCFYVYYYITRFENKIIQIDDEFSFMSYKNGKNLVMDTNNNIYQVTEVFPLLHFNASEILGQLKAGNTYNVSGFGTRIPALMLYPIITQINHKM